MRHLSLVGSAVPRQPSLPRVEREFVYDRPIPEEWTRRLREFSEVTEDHGYLELVWEPGDPWNPVQRWELWELLHPSNVDFAEVLELRGAHPRTVGHPCTARPISSWALPPDRDYQPCLCRHKLEKWRGAETSVSLTQWKLFQRTRAVGRPFWIIQGTTGGHKFGFSHDESLLLEHEGYPTKAPPSGSLPYAPFDERVVSQISRFNRLWQFRNNLQDYKETMGAGYEKYRKETNKELRRQLVEHLKIQMADVAQDFIRAADLGQMDHLPTTDIDYDRLAEENEAHYVETGTLLHPSAIR